MSGCLKVQHLGDRTARSYDAVFELQERALAPSPRWQVKDMEAEMGTSAARSMVEKPKAASSSNDIRSMLIGR